MRHTRVLNYAKFCRDSKKTVHTRAAQDNLFWQSYKYVAMKPHYSEALKKRLIFDFMADIL